MQSKVLGQAPYRTKVVFGKKGLLAPTPPVYTKIATVALYVAAVFNAALLAFPQIPTEIKTDIALYSTEGVAFIHAICNLFGITIAAPNANESL